MNLHPLDIAVIAIPLLAVFTISMVMRRYLRSVADYLAASRSCGRYLICTAASETGVGVIILVMTLEVFSKVGFSLNLWQSFVGLMFVMLALFAFVTFRFRETRVLTFHQFFEVRYSKGLRVFATTLNVFSGLFNFGIVPGVGARFFVYYLNLPENLMMFGASIPTFWPVMIIFMAITVYFTLSGGNLSVMMTDCLEGVISGVFYLVIAFTLFFSLTYDQMGGALMSGEPGKSYINPFDISGHQDFNGFYIIIGVAMSLYIYRGNAWDSGMAASARNAHEGRMASILSIWRSQAHVAMLTLVAAGAFTVLHHADFTSQAEAVKNSMTNLPPQLATQQTMSAALGVLLPAGVKGAFCAVLLMGLFAGQSAALHSFGTAIVQDIVVPNRKKAFQPKAQIRLLRWSTIGVAVFALLWSMFYKPADYLVMVTAVIGAIYLAGVGAVVLGGLYWKRATTAGAWASLGAGAVLAITAYILQHYWTSLQPFLLSLTETGSTINAWLSAHAAKFPVNGQIMSLVIYGICGTLFVTVSLWTCKVPYDMDRMLHRGKYRIDEGLAPAEPKKRWSFLRLIGVDENYTKKDKILVCATFGWTLTWNLIAFGLVMWNIFVNRWTDLDWWHWKYVVGIILPLIVGTVTTIWFTIGAVIDMRDLFRRLRTVNPNDQDDGRVVGHQNQGEIDLVKKD
ncbi:MAG: hypothetical protein AAB263_09930 [Planctomycetota bacterium]